MFTGGSARVILRGGGGSWATRIGSGALPWTSASQGGFLQPSPPRLSRSDATPQMSAWAEWGLGVRGYQVGAALLRVKSIVSNDPSDQDMGAR